MLRHNLLLIYRSFKKDKSTFFINLIGLSTGLACVLLIYLWVGDELKVDKFHEKDSQLYQVMFNLEFSQSILTFDRSPVPLAAALLEEMPEVEYAVSVNNFFSWQSREGILSAGDTHIQAGGWHASADFFHVFSYDLIQGNKDQVLVDKSNIVISEGLAKKLFPTTDNVIGKTLEWKHAFFEGTFRVSGIFKDPPAHSTAQFDFLISVEVLLDNDHWAKEWTGNYADTYIILNKGTDISEFNKKIGGDYLESKNALLGNSSLFVQQYSSKYLYGQYENGVQAGGRIAYVRLFSIVALFILLIACVNFMNLSTAKASLKMKEIGVKKTIGATRKALAAQFLGESLLMAFLSLLVAVVLVMLLLPQFNEISGKHLHLTPGTDNMLAFIGIILFTGLLAGSYPAFYLSGFRPIAVLKGKLPTATGDLWLRKGLVVFQFALSVIFIVGLFVVNGQIRYTQTKNLGYNRDNILSFQWKGELFAQGDARSEGKSNARFETFMLGLKDVPGVVNATSMGGNILDYIAGQSGISWSGQESERSYHFQSPLVDYNFIETLGIELIAGRSFSREHNDDYSKIILNEAAVELMELEDPVGTTIEMNGGSQIIGVVKDFHYGSLHNAIEPLIFRFYQGRNVMVKIEAGKEMATTARLKEYYHEFLPEYAFEFTFMDEDYQALYEAETRVAALSKYFTAIAIIVSCLGLFGLAAFTAERRVKEIGIRKVMGASEWGIIKLLSGDFARMVGMAIIVALPLSYYFTKSWLAGFADSIDLEWWYFIGAGLLTMLIALLTVSFQSVKAALMNPVESLRSE